MGKAPTKKATGGPFNPLHTSIYGLKVMERCLDTQRVISVRGTWREDRGRFDEYSGRKGRRKPCR
jgi:hypothetical protein